MMLNKWIVELCKQGGNMATKKAVKAKEELTLETRLMRARQMVCTIPFYMIENNIELQEALTATLRAIESTQAVLKSRKTYPI